MIQTTVIACILFIAALILYLDAARRQIDKMSKEIKSLCEWVTDLDKLLSGRK